MPVRFHEQVRPYLVPIEQVSQHPDNPNSGDVDVIADSILTNGFYNPILVQKSTGYILAGNHRYAALLSLGETQVPVIQVDVDNEKALRILIADNRTSELAIRNLHEVQSILEALENTDVGLSGTGYDDDALLDLKRINALAESEGFGQAKGNDHDPDTQPYIIIYGIERRGMGYKPFETSDLDEVVSTLRQEGYNAVGRSGYE